MNTSKHVLIAVACLALLATFASAPVEAQSEVAQIKIQAHATNRPLPSLAAAAERARAHKPTPRPPREIPNFLGEGRPAFGGEPSAPDAVLQDSQGSALTALGSGFFGASSEDNLEINDIGWAPPDTNGEVGTTHFVQMVNALTTVFFKDGEIVSGPFPNNAFWEGMGGNCEPYNQGDPIVLYDDDADRWLFSQFAFPDRNFETFSQCIAVSQTGDPMVGYNRYEYVFDDIGLNDYPKHGIVADSITMTANLFRIRGVSAKFDGSFLGVIDKGAMYAGAPVASLIGFNIGKGEFGFLAGDLDGGGSAPALFATAMSQANLFDIWQIDIDWSDSENASVSRIASIPITPFSGDLCTAGNEECIPQPEDGWPLAALSDRLMHRLQLRDFGNYRTMVTAHTVDVGGGRAGIRWYELRESGGTWALHQEGTFGPDDGEYRWLPSAAMNAGGDIGIGYALSSTNTYVSTMAAGQSAANSGSGVLDAGETLCAGGLGVQVGTNRSGDYSATSVNPTNDSFWHTNEVFTDTGPWRWNTYVCEFTVGTGNIPPTASFTYICTDLACDFTDTSTNGDGSIVGWSWDFGDGVTSTAQSPNHTFATSGTYHVTLTVTDDGGATGVDAQDVTVSDGANTPPTASFTFSCTDLGCDFTDTSTDIGGSVTGWSWGFGEGGTSTEQHPSYSFAAAGTYTVTLTVTDDGGANDTTSQPVTVTAPSTGITLTVIGYKVKGRQMADLEWDGATSESVDVFRDDELITTIPNEGFYTDIVGQVGGGTHTYQVCEEGTDICSNEVIVNI